MLRTTETRGTYEMRRIIICIRRLILVLWLHKWSGHVAYRVSNKFLEVTERGEGCRKSCFFQSRMLELFYRTLHSVHCHQSRRCCHVDVTSRNQVVLPGIRSGRLPDTKKKLWSQQWGISVKPKIDVEPVEFRLCPTLISFYPVDVIGCDVLLWTRITDFNERSHTPTSPACNTIGLCQEYS